MDKFLDKYDLPKLNKKDISHLNRSINKQWNWSSNKSLSTKKSPGPNELYQIFKELMQIVLKLFYKTEREGILPSKLIL
jgi:hypothetical protein